MLKKLILIAALIGVPFKISHATTWKAVQASTAGTAQAGMAGYAMNLGTGTISILNSTAATITGTLTMPNGSTAAFSGSVSITGSATASSMTVTDARFLAMTINGAVKDRNLSSGTTFDYLLGGSSSTWTHQGLVLQSTQSFVLNLSSAANSSTFVKTNAKVTITPKFANSLLRISLSAMLANSNPSGDTCELALFRNGSNLTPGGGSNDWVRFTGPTAGNHNFFVAIGPYNDFPGSTSAQTYEIYMRNSAGGSTCTLGSAGITNLIIDEIGQ